MADVLCSTSMLQNTPYMARGIYEDESGADQNHTFCVIGHERGRNFFFSVVECVTPILVLNVSGKEQCKQRQDAFANNFGNKTQMHVMNKKMMAQRYKHILWVGPYMVFECIAASGSKHAYISFGAGSYQNYTGVCVCVYKRSPLVGCAFVHVFVLLVAGLHSRHIMYKTVYPLILRICSQKDAQRYRRRTRMT